MAMTSNYVCYVMTSNYVSGRMIDSSRIHVHQRKWRRVHNAAKCDVTVFGVCGRLIDRSRVHGCQGGGGASAVQ